MVLESTFVQKWLDLVFRFRRLLSLSSLNLLNEWVVTL